MTAIFSLGLGVDKKLREGKGREGDQRDKGSSCDVDEWVYKGR